MMSLWRSTGIVTVLVIHDGLDRRLGLSRQGQFYTWRPVRLGAQTWNSNVEVSMGRVASAAAETCHRKKQVPLLYLATLSLTMTFKSQSPFLLRSSSDFAWSLILCLKRIRKTKWAILKNDMIKDFSSRAVAYQFSIYTEKLNSGWIRQTKCENQTKSVKDLSNIHADVGPSTSRFFWFLGVWLLDSKFCLSGAKKMNSLYVY
jgi:hypothetical protein